MLARGGRLVLATARRQRDAGHGRPVLSSAAYATTDFRFPVPSFTKRDYPRTLTTEVVSEPISDERRRVLNRVLYRSRQRGYLELDLLLGKWATDHIDTLDDKGLGALIQLLEEENPDLLSWITGQSEAPEDIANNPIFLAIHKQVSERLTAHSSAQTRAQPGQPWVRGWDDNRKIGGPSAGNQ